MAWIEGSALGHAMRNSGVWSYGVVNLAHILGISSLFGSVLILDLRLMGAWAYVPLASITRPILPVAATGFAVAMVSGACMIATNATEYADNPFIFIKFPAIALAVLNVAALNFMPAWKRREAPAPSPRDRRLLAIAGGVSLLCWLTAIAAGRMIGYW